jgi:AraC-like DNA-binding protein
MGPKNDLIRIRDNALRLSRAASDKQSGDRELFAITYQHRGTSYFLEADGRRVEHAGELFMEDVTRGYEFAFGGEADISAFVMPHEDLGLPDAFVEIASRRLESSRLYKLVRADFATLSDAARDLSGNEDAAGLLAAAMVSLTRALLASTDSQNRHVRDAIEDALPDTVALYIRHHLNDASLDAERIASASHISTRRLGRLWAAAGEDLEVWILRQRLQGARQDLTASASPHQAIDAIAQRWGFADPSTFRESYRHEYGVYPGE